MTTRILTSIALALFAIACGSPEDITREEAELIAEQTRELGSACDEAFFLEYCWGVGLSAYSGQCAPNGPALVPGICIIADLNQPCAWEAEMCNLISAQP